MTSVALISWVVLPGAGADLPLGAAADEISAAAGWRCSRWVQAAAKRLFSS